MDILNLNSRWKEIAWIWVACIFTEIASGNSTAPPPPSIKDIATQREHVLGGLNGNVFGDTVCRYPRNYFPFIQTPEGQELLNKELAKLGPDNWRQVRSPLREALVAFVALRGDEDWYRRFSAYCAIEDNPVRESIVESVGFARTERAKRFVIEQIDVAYAEAIKAAHGPWKDFTFFIYLGNVARVLRQFDQPDTSARVDELIARLRAALPGPEYDERVFRCEMEIYQVFKEDEIARYREIRNLPGVSGIVAKMGASEANAESDKARHASLGDAPENETSIGWFAGIAAVISACAIWLFFWEKRGKRGQVCQKH